MSNFFYDCLDDNTPDKEENDEENQSQQLFEPPCAKKAIMKTFHK